MRFLTISLFIFYLIPSFGQTPIYVSFPDSNATWCAQRSFLNFGNPSSIHEYNYILEMKGDTTVNGIDYHKIYESGILTITQLPAGSPISTYYSNEYKGGIRESVNKVIYAISPISGNEGVLYDFNLSLGDTLPFASNLMVTSIDSIFDGNIYRTKYNISSIDTITWPDPMYYEHVSLIDGIGSTGGLLWSLGPYFEHWGILYEFNYNGSIYYQDSINTCNISLHQSDPKNDTPSINIYPIPCKDKLYIEISETNGELLHISILNMMGQLSIETYLGNGKHNLDIEELNPGFYIYQIDIKKGIIKTGKLIQQ
jgi:hypothetical protein